MAMALDDRRWVRRHTGPAIVFVAVNKHFEKHHPSSVPSGDRSSCSAAATKQGQEAPQFLGQGRMTTGGDQKSVHGLPLQIEATGPRFRR
jgi:hypothetical protein